MKHFIRIIVCTFSSFAAVYISGYGNLMNDISESLAITSFIGAVVILSAIIFLVWELHSANKSRIEQLNKRIEELEKMIDNK